MKNPILLRKVKLHEINTLNKAESQKILLKPNVNRISLSKPILIITKCRKDNTDNIVKSKSCKHIKINKFVQDIQYPLVANIGK